MKKVDPPKIGHFRGGLLSSLLAKNPSKWLYYENFFTLVTSKMHFEPLRGFFGQKWRKQTPPKMANLGGGSIFFTFGQKSLWMAQNANFGSKITDLKNRSNFGVSVRTQNLTKSHFFNCLWTIPPLSSIWDGVRLSTIHITPILTYIFNFRADLPSKISELKSARPDSKLIENNFFLQISHFYTQMIDLG